MRKIVVISILVGIILGLSVSFFIFEKKEIKEVKPTKKDEEVIEEYSVLEQLGYSKEESTIISSLKDESIIIITGNKYLEYIPELINSKYFIESKLTDYINNYTKDILTTTELVNTNAYKEHYTNIKKTPIDDTMLVNKYYALDEEYEPDDLEKVTIGYGSLRKNANDALTKMSIDAKRDGITLYVTSSYRPYLTQKTLYDNYVKKDGVEKANRYSAKPGHSEHQTGLAVDFIRPGGTFRSFSNSKDFKWLEEKAYKYGFILRYPSDKENITGFEYESWHYRYVGNAIAKYINDNKITYDEYYAYYLEGKNEKTE